MSTFVPCARTVHLEAVGNLLGQACETAFHWVTNEVISEEFLSDACDVLDLWLRGTLESHVSSHLAFTKVIATDLSSQNGPSYIKTLEANSGGVTEATGLPSNVALAVKHNTLKRGRSYRGRNYLMGIPIAAQVNGDADTITVAYVSDYLLDYGILVTDLNAFDSDGYLCVASKFHNGNPRTLGEITPVVSFSINDQLDSQRRRLRGRGA